MNICFFIGKVVSDIDFKFILNSKSVSIAIFELELNNKSIIKVKTYDELADICYRKLKKTNVILIQGYVNSNMEVVGEDIIKLFK